MHNTNPQNQDDRARAALQAVADGKLPDFLPSSLYTRGLVGGPITAPWITEAGRDELVNLARKTTLD